MICPSCRATNDDAADMCFNCGRGLSGLTRGSVIAGRYEILEQLGRGGMGLVYKAHDQQLDEVVVLKLLRADLARAEGMAKRFRSEIKLARRVRHPNVCAIHEFGQDGEFCFITMELVDGADLKREMRRKGALATAEAFDVALQLASGLQAIHEGGIVHRDLKTANIMRDRTGRVRLMDFGIAKQVHSDSTGVTLTGQVIGTPEYMSPEQALGTAVDYRSDVYALGVVLFEIFTGRVPFQGETPIATLRKQVNDPPPLAGAEAAGLPRTMVAVLARALAKEPEARYGTAAELRDAIEWARAASPGEMTVRIAPRVAGATAPALTPAPARPPEMAHATPVPGRMPTAVGSAVTVATAPVARRRALWWAAGLGGGLALAVAAAVVATRLEVPPTPAPSRAPVSPVPSAEAPLAVPTTTLPPATTPATVPPATAPPATPVARPPTPTPRAATPAPTARPEPERRAPTPAPLVPAAPTPAPVPTPPPATGRLQILARPWAEVAVDGRRVGTTPFRPIELPAGEHTVVFSHPDYKSFQRKITVAAGQTTRLEIDLSYEAFPK